MRYSKTHYNKNGEKMCTKCGVFKEISEFHKNSKSQDGLKLWCKACVKEYDKKENKPKLALPEKVVNGLIHCRRCNKYFSEIKFSKSKSYCNDCVIGIGHQHNIKRKKISVEQYIEIELSQNGVCKICGEPEKTNKRLSIDHDHTCCPGQETCGNCTRGLICSRCNKALGMVNDDIELLKKMIEYLS